MKATVIKFMVSLLLIGFVGNAQDKKQFFLKDDESKNDDVIMTWNKTTPESEMKDDIKALSNKGITIKYSNLKRNSKGEITAIRVEYADRKGNKGQLVYDNQKPISTIKFFKQDDEIGFGEPGGSTDFLAGNDFFQNFQGGKDFIKQFNFGNDNNDSQSFSFSFPNDEGFSQSKSKIVIKKEGKKPLIIEDGKVVEGGDDYTQDEIDKIIQENKIESYGHNNNDSDKKFDLTNQEGLENFKKQMEKMQNDMKKIDPNDNPSESDKEEFDKTKEEMLKAKEEMLKAKDELEKAKKELEKTNSSLKKQKI